MATAQPYNFTIPHRFKRYGNQKDARGPRPCRWRERSVALRRPSNLQGPPASLPEPVLQTPRALRGVASPPRPGNRPRLSAAGPERVKGASVTPPGRGRGERGGGGARDPEGERVARRNKTSLFRA